jgi:hypothetical protein
MHAPKDDRRKLVRRMYSDRYVLIMLVSFAVSITSVRLFLEVTGYPQIGGETLHLSHVLWGGLLLFISSLMPLIFANKRILDISAILSGAGIGLFIDEVGKFITQSYDYFFPAAAPIIYVFFLLTIQVYRMIKKPKKVDLRTSLFHTLEEFEEVLEGDLSDYEKDKIISRMEKVEYEKENEEKDLVVLKEVLLLFLKDPAKSIRKHNSDIFERAANWLIKLEVSIFTKKNFVLRLRFAWVILGAILIGQPIFIIFGVEKFLGMTGLIRKIMDSSLFITEKIDIFGMLRLGLQIISGSLLWICAFFYRRESSLKWVSFAQLIMLVVLSAVNSLVFLYDQFSTILFVVIELFVFFLTNRYLNWRRDFEN